MSTIGDGVNGTYQVDIDDRLERILGQSLDGRQTTMPSASPIKEERQTHKLPAAPQITKSIRPNLSNAFFAAARRSSGFRTSA